MNVEEAIDAADINALKWQPLDGFTHCNQWTREVARRMGAHLPAALANDVAEWLALPSSVGYGWVSATEQTAREWCDAGGLAVAVWANRNGPHGHIAPLTLGQPGKTYVAQVGKSVKRRCRLSGAFGGRIVRFYTFNEKHICESPKKP